jgi:hypothetical protein
MASQVFSWTSLEYVPNIAETERDGGRETFEGNNLQCLTYCEVDVETD